MDNTIGQKHSRGAVDLRSVRSVCILGKGVTGEAVERYFRSLTDPLDITILDDDSKVEGYFDLAIVSPGIPPHNALVKSVREHAVELISEPELAFRISPERWIVVTGTNGKTTTTALTAQVLQVCGIKARVAGNIGTTCIEAVCKRDSDEYIVAELSSYQLHYSATIKPDAAILLNITPDHLQWHGSFEAYRDAKLSLFRRMHDKAPAVIDATLEETRNAVLARRASGARVIPLGTEDGLTGDMTLCGSGASAEASEAAFIDPKTQMLTCVVNGQRQALIKTTDLLLQGAHNQENALAAAAVALSLGADPQKVATALASFKPLEHRIEPCGLVGGVSFFNDSKATNPEATIKALDAFEGKPLVLLLGGRDKNTSLDELVVSVYRTCRVVVCYGEAGPRFAEALASGEQAFVSGGQALTSSGQAPASGGQGELFASLLVDDFKSAFTTAVAQGRPGDSVLLSPACASFDEFISFEQRGKVFKEYVAALKPAGLHTSESGGCRRVS